MDTWGVTLPFLIVGGGGRINRGVRHFISNSKLFFGGGGREVIIVLVGGDT